MARQPVSLFSSFGGTGFVVGLEILPPLGVRPDIILWGNRTFMADPAADLDGAWYYAEVTEHVYAATYEDDLPV